jgi:hypothetical protein
LIIRPLLELHWGREWVGGNKDPYISLLLLARG